MGNVLFAVSTIVAVVVGAILLSVVGAAIGGLVLSWATSFLTRFPPLPLTFAEAFGLLLAIGILTSAFRLYARSSD